ncbi:MAG TPA: hypothetical protein VNX02_04650 [Steroidobacteraceae bacterium]|nr:hypothetical protein [Steroidobacteraceae bacterium]
MTPPRPPQPKLSRRGSAGLGALEASVQKLGMHRRAALRLLLTSRNATTTPAQREFWLEFSWIDEEYRAAVRRLAAFCAARRDGSGAREACRELAGQGS